MAPVQLYRRRGLEFSTARRRLPLQEAWYRSGFALIIGIKGWRGFAILENRNRRSRKTRGSSGRFFLASRLDPLRGRSRVHETPGRPRLSSAIPVPRCITARAPDWLWSCTKRDRKCERAALRADVRGRPLPISLTLVSNLDVPASRAFMRIGCVAALIVARTRSPVAVVQYFARQGRCARALPQPVGLHLGSVSVFSTRPGAAGFFTRLAWLLRDRVPAAQFLPQRRFALAPRWCSPRGRTASTASSWCGDRFVAVHVLATTGPRSTSGQRDYCGAVLLVWYPAPQAKIESTTGPVIKKMKYQIV